jgi:hypothetical protein
MDLRPFHDTARSSDDVSGVTLVFASFFLSLVRDASTVTYEASFNMEPIEALEWDIVHLEEQIAELQTHLRQLQSRQNALAPLCWLPTEILVDVMKLLSRGARAKQKGTLAGWTRVMGVGKLLVLVGSTYKEWRSARNGARGNTHAQSQLQLCGRDQRPSPNLEPRSRHPHDGLSESARAMWRVHAKRWSPPVFKHGFEPVQTSIAACTQSTCALAQNIHRQNRGRSNVCGSWRENHGLIDWLTGPLSKECRWLDIDRGRPWFHPYEPHLSCT